MNIALNKEHKRSTFEISKKYRKQKNPVTLKGSGDFKYIVIFFSSHQKENKLVDNYEKKPSIRKASY